MPQFTRREFVLQSLLGATALAAGTKPAGYDIAALELGHFESYTPDQTAEAFADIGMDAEITVRRNGHIKPERVPDELPVLVDALRRRGRRVLFIALDTVRPDEPYWHDAVRTARDLGIRQYRHRGFKYELGKPLKPQIANFHAMAREFAAANRELGVQALYQTHATPVMAGGAVWDLDLILGDIDPRNFGVGFDTRHVMVEQGMSWPNAINLIGPRIAALYVKSFRWEGDKPVAVPLKDGIVKPDIVKQVLARAGRVPICLHVEYFGLAPKPYADRARHIRAFLEDSAVLRSWLA